jgi:hypothetical protein
MVNIRFICVFLLFFAAQKGSCQSLTRALISVTGNSSKESGGLISYSVGEAITGSLITPINGITQGFQQPSLLNTGEVDLTKGINAVEVFPNPVVEDLTILFNIRTTRLLHVELYSSKGSLFRSENFSVHESGTILINMRDYPCGLYLLHVYSTEKVIDRLFKIEKM